MLRFETLLFKRLIRSSGTGLQKTFLLLGGTKFARNFLASTHVYYSSCWFPSKACYQKLGKLHRDFI